MAFGPTDALALDSYILASLVSRGRGKKRRQPGIPDVLFILRRVRSPYKPNLGQRMRNRGKAELRKKVPRAKKRSEK